MPSVQVQITTTSTGNGAQQTAQGLGQVGAAATKAEKQLLSYAQAQARLQSSQGNNAGAARTLTAALGQVNSASIQAMGAQRQLIGVQNQLNQGLKGGESYAQQFGSALKGQLLGMVGPAAAAGAALKVIQTGIDLAQAGAQIQSIKQSFDALAQSANTTGDALLTRMHAAAQGTISDAKLMESTNTGLLLTSGKIAQDLPRLLEIARASAKATGQDVGFVFDSLVRGIARGSPLIIDNAGITLNAADAMNTYAASIGKTADQLTKSEQQQATLNAVVAAGNDIIAKTGASVESNAVSFQRFGTLLENLKNQGAAGLSNELAPMAGAIVDVASATDGSAQSFQNAASGLATLVQSMEQTRGASAAQVQANEDMAASMMNGVNAILAFVGVNQQAAGAVAAETDIEQQRIATLNASAALAAQVTSAEIGYANAMAMSTVQANAAKAAAEQKANADQVAAVDAQTHALAQQQLAEQAQNAARALLAAGGQGAATAATLAGSSQQVDVLTAAYYRLMAAQQAAGAVAKQQSQQAFAAANRGGRITAARAQAERNLEQQQIAAAKREQTLAVGTTAQKQALLQQEYNQAVKLHGATSAEAIKAQTALLQAQERGGAARASSAQKGADKLTTIEQNTGDKLLDIDAQTQEKLAQLDEQAAERRAAAQRAFAAAVATSSADLVAQQEANDLELVNADASRKADLIAREQAEAKARIANEQAVSEAKQIAAEGDAETAQKVLDERQKQISAQQSLDEEYAKRQAELAGNPDALAALQQQYDQATQAIQAAAQVRIDLAKQAAQQEEQAAAAKRDAVIAAAEEEKNQVAAKAETAAGRVKAASADAKNTAVANLHAIGDAVNAIPSEKHITVTVSQQGSAATTGQTRAAGGGTFVTHGRTTLTVGDNPGGAELVHVTPLSGKGTTRVGSGMTRLAGGGAVAALPDPGTVASLVETGILNGGKGGGGGGGAGGGATANLEAATKAMQQQIAFLEAMAKLSVDLTSPTPPIDEKYVTQLANESVKVGEILGRRMVPVSEANVKTTEAFTKAVGQAIGLLSDMQGLRKDLSEKTPPLNEAYAKRLAYETTKVGEIVGRRMVPVSEYNVLVTERYTSAVSQAISLLKDMQGLRQELGTPQPPISEAVVKRLATEARKVGEAVGRTMVPVSKDMAEKTSLYADAVGSSVSVLKDVSDLSGKLFADYQSPTDAQIDLLAKDANRVTRSIVKAASTYSKDGLEAGKAFAESVGATFSAFRDGLLFFQALNSDDFALNPGGLAKFEAATQQTLAVARRLSAQAATIPAGDLQALQNTTAALSAQAEALIRLAAVPFGDLPQATKGFAQQSGALLGGAGAGVTVNIYNPPANLNTAALITQVKQALTVSTTQRRY